uniref:Cytochrome P450 1B1-like n=1 Tax=Geotrypetes seraphini TaxID=260995 RepID=A0A6P8RTM9_GEOSA|nr:cytochrome P450 1B1-like [Geotrypetes seraphini]
MNLAGMAELGSGWKEQVQPALLASLLLLLCFEVALRVRSPRRTRSPPGPFAWPLLGNVMQLGELPHLTFCRMAQKYGDVFQIRLGRRAVLVLNGEAAIRRALLGQCAQFAGRPGFSSYRAISGGKSMAFGGYSELWRLHRKIAHSTLRAFSSADADARAILQRHIADEARELVEAFASLSARGRYFDPSLECTVAVANVICALCFGQRYGHEDQEFKSLLGRTLKFGQTVGAGSLVDLLPWLQTFPNPARSLYRSFQELNREAFDFVKAKISHHRRTYDPAVTRDMSDAFIRDIGRLGDGYVEGTVTDLFGAGQDTNSAALTWVLFLLVRYPHLQARLHEELEGAVGRERLPAWEDRRRLPFLEAFLYETLRFSSFVPFTIPHCTTADVTVDGFHVPKDTVVFVNQWSVNHDRAKWKDPHAFDPGRFLDDKGELDRDLAKGVLIFSLGKRRCIGDEFSKVQLFLFTAILLHQCTFLADPAEGLSMGCVNGLTLRPRPFSLSVTLRHRRRQPSASDSGPGIFASTSATC